MRQLFALLILLSSMAIAQTTVKPSICNAACTPAQSSMTVTWNTDTDNTCTTPSAATTKMSWSRASQLGTEYVTAETDLTGVTAHSVTISNLPAGAALGFDPYSSGLTSGVVDHAKENFLTASGSTSPLTCSTLANTSTQDVEPYLQSPTVAMAGTPLQVSVTFILLSGTQANPLNGSSVIWTLSLSGGNSASWTTPFFWENGTNHWAGAYNLMTKTVTNDSEIALSTNNPQDAVDINIPSNATLGTYTLTMTCFTGANNSSPATWVANPSTSCTSASVSFTVQASATPSLNPPCPTTPGSVRDPNCGVVPSVKLASYNSALNTWAEHWGNPTTIPDACCTGEPTTAGTPNTGLSDTIFGYYDAPHTLFSTYDYDRVFNISAGNAGKWFSYANTWCPNAFYRQTSTDFRQNQTEGVERCFVENGTTPSAYNNVDALTDIKNEANGLVATNLIAPAYSQFIDDRPAGYALNWCREARKHGLTTRPGGCDDATVHLLIYRVLTHLLESMGYSSNWPTSGIVQGAAPTKEAFIVGLNSEAAIRCYLEPTCATTTYQTQIIEVERIVLNNLQTNWWDSTNQCYAFQYNVWNPQGTGLAIDTPDTNCKTLDMWDAFAFAWLWSEFGDSVTVGGQNYRQIADADFNGQDITAANFNGKSAEDDFRFLFPYLQFRGVQMAPLPAVIHAVGLSRHPGRGRVVK